MAKNNLGSFIYPFRDDPDNAHTGTFQPVTLTTSSPLISNEAMLCVQSFANAACLPLNIVVSEALLYWWDTHGSSIVLELERCSPAKPGTAAKPLKSVKRKASIAS